MKIAYIFGDEEATLEGGDGKSTHMRGTVNALREAGHEVEYLTKNRLSPLSFQDEAELASILGGMDPDFIYERYHFPSTEAQTVSQELNIPRILEFNFSHVYGGERDKSIPDKQAALPKERDNLISADAVVTVSVVTQEYLSRLGVENIVISPVCVSAEEFNPANFGANEAKREYGLDSSIVAGFVGSFQGYHGPEETIQAIEEVKESGRDIKFLFVGGGRKSDEFRTRVEGKGLEDRTVFTGRLSRAPLIKAISAFDIAFMTTPDYEPDEFFTEYHGFPAKLLEYMAMARATIAPRVRTVQGLITSGENGILIPPGNGEKLAKAILELSEDGRKRKRLGRGARQTILRDHTWERKARDILKLAETIRTDN